MTIHGWDASDFDWDRGPMNLAAARSAGIVFFTHKATEGTTTKHLHYGTAMDRARAAGIPVLGAYIVARTGNPQAEVDYFLTYVTQQTPWWRDHPGWFWQVDLEHWPYDAVTPGTGDNVADLLVARTGRAAIVYASRGQYGNTLSGVNHPLWNAAYPSSRPAGFRDLYPGDSASGWVPYSGQTPVIWQYSSAATIGTQPGCDANAYRGTLTDLLALIGGDMALADDPDGKWMFPRIQAIAQMQPPVNGPEQGADLPVLKWMRQVAADAATAAAKAGQGTPVTLTDTDRAALIAALPTAADVATHIDYTALAAALAPHFKVS